MEDDATLDEVERVQNALEKIRNRGDDAVLNEIRNIKDKHEQLEGLTNMKKRAEATQQTKQRITAKQNQVFQLQ